jgi:pimeloyl-ACP methyl ester carboxylesterase
MVGRRLVTEIVLVLLLGGFLLAQGEQSEKDTSKHKVQFVDVDKDVKLEVLDWGGTGRGLIFLAGNGFTAHDFDAFAPKFTATHHVYGITRRGFGASSAPAPAGGNYSADRLGDDVLAVIEALHLDKPVLVGHSLGGQELSSVASRHPEKVSGLVYLDAGYAYAFYDARRGDLVIDSIDLRNKLERLLSANVSDMKAFLQELEPDVARYDADIKRQQKELSFFPPQPPREEAPPPILVAISNGMQRYTKIPLPALAIFAAPHGELSRMAAALYADDATKREALLENDRAKVTAQADAFREGVPGSKVVVLPNASHFIFKSNEEDVIKEMNSFLSSLK